MYKFSQKKSLGQHFLKNKDILDKISKLENFERKLILEIGPGKGALTKILLKQNPKKLIAVEKDKELDFILKKIQDEYPEKLEVIYQDALKFNLDKINSNKINLVANLPYNIATTLIIQWLLFVNKFESILVMVQKEVADRLIAKVSNKHYSRTSILVQLHFTVEKIFDVSPENFYPKPKVMSSIIKLIPKKRLNFNYNNLDETLKICFSHRRKKLKNNIKKFSSKVERKILDSDINVELRPQDITIDEYLNLSKLLI